MDQKKIELVFKYSLIFKAIFAALEIVGGFAAFFVTQAFLLKVVAAVTQNELIDDPSDQLVSYLTHAATSFTVSTKYFTAFYLISHGAVKLFLIIGLLRKKLWFYPASMVVFGLFILYQSYRFLFTHSVWLLLLTIVDVVVIWLTWQEYQFIKGSTAT